MCVVGLGVCQCDVVVCGWVDECVCVCVRVGGCMHDVGVWGVCDICVLCVRCVTYICVSCVGCV